MPDFTVWTETGQDDDQSWLASDHGVDTADSITLDGALLIALYTDGHVPSGVVLGKVTATGRYAPYDDSLSNGQNVAAGILLTHVNVSQKQGLTFATHNVGGALFWHGAVIAANLPAQSGAGSIDTAGKADLPQIRFV